MRNDFVTKSHTEFEATKYILPVHIIGEELGTKQSKISFGKTIATPGVGKKTCHRKSGIYIII